MAQTLTALNSDLDEDFQTVIKQLQDIFQRVATKVHGRATHTYGVGARGEARIVYRTGFRRTISCRRARRIRSFSGTRSPAVKAITARATEARRR
jgi:hypothetical protein